MQARLTEPPSNVARISTAGRFGVSLGNLDRLKKKIGQNHTLAEKLWATKAEAAARRIGPIEVDHGETGCVTPDSIPYIERMWARKKKGASR